MTGGQFDTLYGAINELSAKVGGVAATVDQVNDRVGRVDGKLDRSIERIGELEKINAARAGAAEAAAATTATTSANAAIVIGKGQIVMLALTGFGLIAADLFLGMRHA